MAAKSSIVLACGTVILNYNTTKSVKYFLGKIAAEGTAGANSTDQERELEWWNRLTTGVIYIMLYIMTRRAKVFRNGRSQAVRLPAEYRFDTSEVYVRQDAATGDIILSRRPESWQDFFEFADRSGVPKDFMSERHDASPQKRTLF